MSDTVRVNVARAADAAGILVDMAARGFEGDLEPTDSGVSVVLAGHGANGDLDRQVWLALEDTIAERHLPLVPVADGEHRVLLRPAFV